MYSLEEAMDKRSQEALLPPSLVRAKVVCLSVCAFLPSSSSFCRPSSTLPAFLPASCTRWKEKIQSRSLPSRFDFTPLIGLDSTRLEQSQPLRSAPRSKVLLSAPAQVELSDLVPVCSIITGGGPNAYMARSGQESQELTPSLKRQFC